MDSWQRVFDRRHPLVDNEGETVRWDIISSTLKYFGRLLSSEASDFFVVREKEITVSWRQFSIL